MPRRVKLTKVQKVYIWSAGSFGRIVQGVGERQSRVTVIYYASAGEAVLYGYHNPTWFLEKRGLIEPAGTPFRYKLTLDGERAFSDLQASKYGEEYPKHARLVKRS